jgi:hypothetical protein
LLTSSRHRGRTNTPQESWAPAKPPMFDTLPYNSRDALPPQAVLKRQTTKRQPAGPGDLGRRSGLITRLPGLPSKNSPRRTATKRRRSRTGCEWRAKIDSGPIPDLGGPGEIWAGSRLDLGWIWAGSRRWWLDLRSPVTAKVIACSSPNSKGNPINGKSRQASAGQRRIPAALATPEVRPLHPRDTKSFEIPRHWALRRR